MSGPAFNENLKCLSMDAKWVIYGTMGGPKLTEPAELARLLLKRASILTSTLRSRDDLYKARLFKQTYDCFESADSLRVIIDRTFNMSDVAAAHEYLESNKSFGKVVLINDL